MDRNVRTFDLTTMMATVREINEKIRETREQAMSLMSPNLKKEIVSKSATTDAAYTKLIDYCVELQGLCDKMLMEASEELSKVSKCIEKLTDVELRNIALMRYVQGAKVDDIADKMHMDRRTVFRKLDKVKEVLKDVS